MIKEAQIRLRLQQQYSKLNAFTYLQSDSEILQQVQEKEKQTRTSNIQGKLFGIKANFCIESWPSDACSKTLKGFKAPYTCTIVNRIRENHGIVIGLTNMDEFGMGSSGETSSYGPTINPYGSHLSCGGSSSGSACAVSYGAIHAAIGSDTGGSVRLPASHCGVVGFKPSRGTLSRYGLIPYASSLDVPGIIAQKVQHVVDIFNLVSGSDSLHDMTTNVPSSSLLSFSKTIKVGLSSDFFYSNIDSSVLNAWKTASNILSDFGLEIEKNDISIPTVSDSLFAYYVIALAEASSNLAKYDGVRYGYRTISNKNLDLLTEYSKTRSEGFGDEVQRRLLMGSLALTQQNNDKNQKSSSYLIASNVRKQLKNEFSKVFEKVDVLLLPTSPWSPLKKTNTSITETFLEDIMTVPASLANLPAISVPATICSKSNGPIGIQVIGNTGNDKLVLQIAQLLENGFKFTPPLFDPHFSSSSSQAQK